MKRGHMAPAYIHAKRFSVVTYIKGKYCLLVLDSYKSHYLTEFKLFVKNIILSLFIYLLIYLISFSLLILAVFRH